ncbi:MAG: alpha/beta hydrolase [Dehalococcoidia bacterium]|nr:alpha/beta hydrolase [Dehalococcoidia bacterium]
MADYRTRTLEMRGGKLSIEVLEGGSGDPLVYLHGARSLGGWNPHLDRLADRYHVFAPCHPGTGGSTGLEHLDDLWDLVLCYEEILDSLTSRPYHIIGLSYGGMIGTELAAQNPAKVRSLVLVGAIGLWLDESPIADIYVLGPEERAKATWHNPASEAARAYMAQPEDPEAKREAELSNIEALASTGKFIWPIPDKGLRKRIHRITSPTLMVWGKSDGLVPPVYADEFQRLIPGSRSVVIEECGHLPYLERPEEYFQNVFDFLSQS